MKKNYTVTPTTGAFVETLDKLEQTKNAFFDALTQLYGETDAGRYYNETSNVWDAVTATIGEYLTNAIVSNLSVVRPDDETKTNI